MLERSRHKNPEKGRWLERRSWLWLRFLPIALAGVLVYLLYKPILFVTAVIAAIAKAATFTKKMWLEYRKRDEN